jgi:hypothetical protein
MEPVPACTSNDTTEKGKHCSLGIASVSARGNNLSEATLFS